MSLSKYWDRIEKDDKVIYSLDMLGTYTLRVYKPDEDHEDVEWFAELIEDGADVAQQVFIEHADIYDAVTLSRALDWAVDWYFMDKGLE